MATGATYCVKAIEASNAAVAMPPHERGFVIAALANHLRECDECRPPNSCPQDHAGPCFEGRPDMCRDILRTPTPAADESGAGA